MSTRMAQARSRFPGYAVTPAFDGTAPVRRAAVLALLALGAGLTAAGQQSERPHRVSAPVSFYDDADLIAPGMASVSTDFFYGAVRAGRDVGFPAASVSVGLSKRFQLSGSVGYDHSRFEESRVTGISDSHLGVKALLFGEGKHRPALAVKPLLEFLGTASVRDNPLAPKRANFILPLITQKSFDEWRVYYTAGYVTRGIVFNTLVVEANRWNRVVPVVVVSGGRLTRELGLISELGLNRSRVDVAAGTGIAIRPGCSVYINAGRSLGRGDPNSSRYQVSAGVNFGVRLWGVK